MSNYLSVLNNGSTSFKAKYNGVWYEFSPKNKTTITFEAAQHIFGVGIADKTEVLSRHGWLTHSSGMSSALAKLDEFSFGAPNDYEEPVVELAEFGAKPAPVAENETEHESALVHLGGVEDAGQLNGEPEELTPPISTGGSILDVIRNFKNSRK
jgi:hypothetical protein